MKDCSTRFTEDEMPQLIAVVKESHPKAGAGGAEAASAPNDADAEAGDG